MQPEREPRHSANILQISTAERQSFSVLLLHRADVLMRALMLFAIMTCALYGATVIDRIAVVLGKHVIKASEIDLDLRVTEFLNREPLTRDAAAKKKSAERLIDQQLIRQELATGGYSRAGEADA